MCCHKLRAYLNEELNPLSRILMYIHIAACPHCRKMMEEGYLSREIRRLEDTPVPPALRDKLMADAISASRTQATPPLLRSRTQGVFTMKRALIAFGLVVVLAVIGLGILPRQGGSVALADVARAMANVKSAHMVVFDADVKTGERHTIEVWIKSPSKYRMLEEGVGEMADNGKRSVEIGTRDGVLTATIEQSKGFKGLEHIMPSLSFFNGEEAVDYLIKENDLAFVGSKPDVLADGRKAKIIELRALEGGKVLITVDDATDRLYKVMAYRKNGKLEDGLEQIEYDMEIPDSMFELRIPKNAMVLDTLTPDSPNLKAEHASIGKKLEASGAYPMWEDLNGSCYVHSKYHSGMRFRTEGNTYIYYLPKRNTYYVFGKALVTDSKIPGFKRVVNEGEFTAPYKPDISQEQVVLRLDKPGDYAEAPGSFDNLRIQNIGNSPMVITYRKRTYDYVIQGKAKLLPLGTVYQNRIVKYGGFDFPEFKSIDPEKLDFGGLPASEVKFMKQRVEENNTWWEWQETANKFKAAGAKQAGCFKYGNWGSSGSLHAGLKFESVPDSGVFLLYLPDRNVYKIMGKVRVRYNNLLHGYDKIIEDDEFEAPGQPTRLKD